jgi:DNA-directed RNA polymerase subunit RPC12/RpoP
MNKLTFESEKCPYCKSNLIAGEIPEKDKYLYGGGKYFYRTIAISSLELDRTIAFRCPDCGAEDEREWHNE